MKRFTHPAYLHAPTAYLPGPPVPNGDMAAYLGQYRGQKSKFGSLVLRKNGIKTRHYARQINGSWLHDLAGMSAAAATDTLTAAGLEPQQVDAIYSACTLGDHLVPGCASQVHARLADQQRGWAGKELASFQSVCAASAMAIRSACAAVRAGDQEQVLLTGGEFASRYLHADQYDHLSTEALPFEAEFLRYTLSDGGGAALISAQPPERGPYLKVLGIDIRSYADRFPICMSGGAARGQRGGWTPWSAFPDARAAAQAGAFNLQQDFALLDTLVEAWVHHYLDLTNSGSLSRSDFDFVVSHYSAKSLRDRALKLLDAAGALVPQEQWYSNLAQTGNIGTASVFALLQGFLASDDAAPGTRILVHVPESGRGLNALMLMEICHS